MAETTMEEVINLEGELVPCEICGRTFLPAPLIKHKKVCERNATKQRKIFDSQKQRVEGTEFAPFNQSHVKKTVTGTPYAADAFKRAKWKEKHLELVKTIRAARGVGMTNKHSASSTSLSHDAPGTERCPSCDRQFGPRAYDRHVEWCKDHVTYVHRSPAQVLLAKERLEARIKYRVPAPKSKRAVVKEKYSPGLGSRTESFSSIKSTSCTYLDNTHKVQKTKPVVNLKKSNEPSVYNQGDSAEINKRTERANRKNLEDHVDPINSVTHPDYNPFLTAERQLMELLECDDFQPFISKHETIKSANRPHTVSGSKTKLNEANHNNNKIVKSAETTRKKLFKNGESKKRASVIDPPTDFQDGDDFELIESLINQNYLESYDLLDAINEDMTKTRNQDDSPTIDPRLINENDNLAIPDHLIVHHSSSNSSNDNLAPLTKISSSTRHLTRSSETLHQTANSRNKVTKTVDTNSKVTKPKKAAIVRKPSVSSSKNAPTSEVRKPAPFKKSLSVQEPPKPKSNFKDDLQVEVLKKPRKSTELPSVDFAKGDDLFDVDDVMLEEFKKFEENYLKDKDKQRRKKERELHEVSTNVDNGGGSPVSKINIDSAYNSLNRNNPKVRAKPNSLSPLEYNRPQTSPIASPTSSSSDTTSMPLESQQRVSKFCHECGTRYPIITAKFCVECGVKRLVL
ncbi:hypothetical protein PPYR_01857 [Photinus pyralis]|uniref:C2HC/C3H-type domain-containing protein n=2 Tax=Photinus pyralis TaxID=7054 RepID=A0A5N4B5J1_PHOPY|nr:uncharacterized protein LOC116158647 isoform X1 [Photinus pyralis]KAB0804887.1 hypothetical protein PPYR_01857 [Photinus pyralis]